MAKPKQSTKADLVKAVVDRMVSHKGNTIAITLPAAPLKPVNGGNRKLLSTNGHTNRARGNILTKP